MPSANDGTESSKLNVGEGNTYLSMPLFIPDTILEKACSSGFSEPF